MKKILTLSISILFGISCLGLQTNLLAQIAPSSYTPERIQFKDWKRQGSSSYPWELPYIQEGGKIYYPWSSSNIGYSYLHKAHRAQDYPVFNDNGRLVLRTLKGKKNLFVNVSVVSGSAFIGRFSKKNMVFNPHKATLFGIPVHKQPLKLKGKYAYSSGDTYLNKKGNAVCNKKDKASIRIILWEDSEKGRELDGNSIFGHPSIVAVGEKFIAANCTDALNSSSFSSFSIALKTISGKQIDFSKKKYRMSIVLASSKDGADYSGAPGSTLVIPYLELEYK